MENSSLVHVQYVLRNVQMQMQGSLSCLCLSGWNGTSCEPMLDLVLTNWRLGVGASGLLGRRQLNTLGPSSHCVSFNIFPPHECMF